MRTQEVRLYLSGQPVIKSSFYDPILEFCGITKGEKTQLFVTALLTIGPLFAASKLLMIGLQLFAGRHLGPEQFGSINLILSVSAILCVPMSLFAFVAMKLASMTDDPSDKSVIVSSTFWGQALWIGAVVFLAYLGRVACIRFFKLPNELWTIAVFFTALTAINSFLYYVMQGLKIFANRAWCELTYGITSVLSFLWLYHSVAPGYASYMLALMIGLTVSTIAAIYSLSPWLKMTIKPAILFSSMSYTFAPFINGVSVALLTSYSPLLLARSLSVTAVGVFSAYRLGSVLVASVISVAIAAVLFPMTTTASNQRGAWSKLLKLTLPLIGGSWLLFASTTAIVIKVIGKAYPLDTFWIVLFSGAGMNCLIFNLVSTMLSANDAAGMWIVVISNILVGLAFAATNLCWTPRYGVGGAALSLFVSYFAGMALCYIYGFKRFVSPAGPRRR